MNEKIQFLKEVLSVPTQTYKEDLMVIFITNWLTENNIPFYVDSHQNVYATKSESNVSDDFYYPCVISHTDTVHTIDTINIKEEQLPNAQGEIKLSLKAWFKLCVFTIKKCMKQKTGGKTKHHNSINIFSCDYVYKHNYAYVKK
mgnify:CR=1 FL=1